ncbi:MAG TPA: redox-regulated ATPase YchF [Bacteroidota bacterium]|nr:redox-regulated ATPase YchF [Bacteroidota bacterium]
MGFTCGIVGLPNVGKSTLFNAITAGHADASNYPFCTIDPNIGIVPIADVRLDVLRELYSPGRTVPSTIEFVDIAGLVRGASAGEGLGNQFLSHIRNVDAIAHVVRCFDDPNVVHVDGSVDPIRDIGVVETELILKDVDTVEKKHADAARRAKGGEKKARAEAEFYARVREHLGTGRLARYLGALADDESLWMRDCHLLTAKPVMYVCNVHEREIRGENARVDAVREIAAREGARVVLVSAAVEAEVARLPEGDREAFLSDLGEYESGLARLVREGYALLSLVTFFTVGSKEVHAWTVPRGTTAPAAAGSVHTDFEKGFIRAEIIKFEDLNRFKAESAVREAGLLSLQGRDYVMQEGDIAHFRFNV